VIRRWNGRTALALGVLVMLLAYAALATCRDALSYDLGAALLGIGFSLIGAVPALHVLSGWERRRQALVYGAYLACGGLGGALWPTLVVSAIGLFGDWRGYWWFMAALMGVIGSVALALIREKPIEPAEDVAAEGWRLAEALQTPQFYAIGCAIAATYLIASTVNAFTVSYLNLIGVASGVAVAIFSIQSACHALFPILMGGLAERVGVKVLLVGGLVIQAIGMLALAWGSSLSVLSLFAIGVGGGYGTIFLATTLSLESYFGKRHFAAIFGANQLFTTISVIGPAIVGAVADRTGRFDLSFLGCGALLLAAAASATLLRKPERRRALHLASHASD
jgi:MFS family permease